MVTDLDKKNLLQIGLGLGWDWDDEVCVVP